ncbi:hypothetical protein BUALT_Bualt01G0223500 [Buddleja alternifolia]|uniref:Uncharacterized protein n=1 Tax=Buddleja alternifolia TaxID=168488 RepID=A0AAV6YG44_9LAMI|nr:hypothetical protein BUALT_Bualt01G0223500 [Buddleja alternifolia]
MLEIRFAFSFSSPLPATLFLKFSLGHQIEKLWKKFTKRICWNSGSFLDVHFLAKNLIAIKLGIQKISGITVFDTIEKKTYDSLLELKVCFLFSLPSLSKVQSGTPDCKIMEEVYEMDAGIKCQEKLWNKCRKQMLEFRLSLDIPEEPVAINRKISGITVFNTIKKETYDLLLELEVHSGVKNDEREIRFPSSSSSSSLCVQSVVSVLKIMEEFGEIDAGNHVCFLFLLPSLSEVQFGTPD